ncbi:hypothetical protein CXF96_04910 [Stenotrophomonas sp. Betaine-02u-21]|nr:hypothetical protein CXF90_06905 [Stenotrophomonas sp. Betaine-02u-23]PKH75239.1 hypothetical protein CXF96_04910 [Stenotrophomonas sp. Betaine-02u-21]PKH97924.1 hypothetical protein CXG43_00115 [Stenotrophomonas sp. Bg11-02]
MTASSRHYPVIDAAPGCPQNRPQKGSSSQRCRRQFEPAGSGATAVPPHRGCERDLRRTAKLCPWIPLPILRCRSSPSGLRLFSFSQRTNPCRRSVICGYGSASARW